MTDQELQQVISEIDSALAILRKLRATDFDAGDRRIHDLLADLRRELAVYRAISEAGAKVKVG